MLHARCVVEALAGGAGQAPLRGLEVNYGAQHPRRDALEAAAQADANLPNRAARIGGGGAQPARTYLTGVCVRMGPEQPECRVTTRCRFARWPGVTSRNRERAQLQLAGAHVRLSVYVFVILNHAIWEHRPNRGAATSMSNSLLQATGLGYFMPALLHSPDGRIKRRIGPF